MRNTKKYLALILAVMMLVSVMAGCGEKKTEEPKEGAKGFDLAVCLASEPETIDPALNSALDGGNMQHHFFEGLMKWVDDGKGNATLDYGQAESMDKVVNNDGTVTYTFKIRKDAKWSDGKPVTAGDFVYSWQRLVDHATASPYSAQLDMVKGYAEISLGTPTGNKVKDKDGNEVDEMKYADASTLAVSAPDDSTFVVTLSYDCPYFKEICAFPSTFPVRKDIIESAGDQWTFKPETYIGNGPYKMSEWVHNSYIKAVKNEYYYDVDKLGPDTITFQLMEDQNAILSAFQSGTLQCINDGVPPEETQSLLASGDLKINPQIGTYYVCFQNQKAPFNDPRVREAFSLAIDRNYIVEKVTQTGEVPATAYVPYGIYDAEGPSGDDFRTVGGEYYSVKAEDYKANCEKARQLLAEAGYPNGEGFPTVEYLYNTNERHKAIAEALQQMWKTELGVNVTINNQEWGVFTATRRNGNYMVARNGWVGDYNDPCTFLDMFVTGNGNNDAKYSNAEFDKYIAQAKSTGDAAERMKAFHTAEDILMKESAMAPIYFYTQNYMVDDSIKGIYYTPLGFYFFGYCTKAE
ncbi:MAG: peptide ABC transporter substrate-binding protein [Clostridiales bacterium]|nr:peptide ABC transporter substrate-binding protein [Clostridiales bacterium]